MPATAPDPVAVLHLREHVEDCALWAETLAYHRRPPRKRGWRRRAIRAYRQTVDDLAGLRLEGPPDWAPAAKGVG